MSNFSTQEPMKNDSKVHDRVFAAGTTWFKAIHGVALVVLSLSFVAVCCMMVVMLYKKPFWKRPIGERFAFYLAVCNVLFDITHFFDHGWLFVHEAHPPNYGCAVLGFLVLEFMLAQMLIILFTSFSSVLMIYWNKRVEIGKYDWRLLAAAFGIPCVLEVPLLVTGHLGPGDAWCFIDMRTKLGPILYTIVAACSSLIFISISVCYSIIQWKIRITSKQITSNLSHRYHRTTKVMMMLVTAFLAQWLFYVSYTSITLFRTPESWIVFLVVMFGNLGGVYNVIAYGFMKKKGSDVAPSSQS